MSEETTLYRYFDSDDVLLYVGITQRDGQRHREHAKNSDWFSLVKTHTITRFANRQDAIEAESFAIATENPLYNVVGQAPKKDNENLFSISAAARVSGKSIPTIHAYLNAGKLPNAVATPKGKSRSWQIPLSDLKNANLISSSKNKDSLLMEKDAEIVSLRQKITALEARLEDSKAANIENKNLISDLFAKALKAQNEKAAN
jgi:predicted GIY-YIG superfamily endonuclease